ncbi:MAG: L-lactate permease [Actinobacteria bacterium]|nr:L-lactate permease [Actinomycetota bacterium]MBU1608544.1 L-lactate permease [Actinomycetota bacterium]MBU2315107.1 L-lactate permease [Actinomycetota bacterium]MBU2384920.1 L-lactate permease [Actinomycetota bacterium]
MFEQEIDPVLGSLALSAIAAALPLVLLFVLLGALKVRAPFAALAALALSVILAVVAWRMPPVQALSAAAEGVFYGLFPILWILANALWIYRLTVVTPWFEVFSRTIRSVSDDLRILSILIAFCFGALLESLAGFGAPVAISAAMLLAAGMAPLKAALVSLLANTAPVAFGALAAPVIALAGVTGLPLSDIAAMTGRQTPFIAVLVPLILVLLVDGRRGLRQTWPVALVAGLVFGAAQFVTANFFAVELTDVVAAVLTIIAVLLMLRVWQPAELVGMNGAVEVGAVAVERPPAREVLMAVAPYAIVIAVFSLAQVPAVAQWLATVGTVTFAWPGLDVVTAAGEPASAQTMHLDTLRATGTLLLLSGLLTVALYRLAPRTALRAYGATLHQLRWTIVTVTAVLALSFVMNLSGQATTIGVALASAGGFFVVLSPIIGWIGVALTGSDTSSNVLFGPVQVAAAEQVGLPPVLMAAANSSAGVLGKMLSVQNLAVAAAAVGQPGSEGALLRKLLPWSLGLLALITVLIVLQSTPVLGWMVP